MIEVSKALLLGALALSCCVGHPAFAASTDRISVGSGGTQADDSSDSPSVSADGRFVAFWSNATNLVAGDTNGDSDVFVRDRQTGVTERVSVDSAGGQADDGSGIPAISADGRFVAFVSFATNLVAGDTNGARDVFVRDRLTGATERVSVNSAEVEANANVLTDRPSISADGRFVTFATVATNLVTGDTNGAVDVFVRDRQAGTTERVSIDSAEAQVSFDSNGPFISADGRFVAFQSDAPALVAGDTNIASDIFVRDRQTGTTERVSVDSAEAQATGASFYPSISADGRFVAFLSVANNLVPGDTSSNLDIFVRDRLTGATEMVGIGGSGGGFIDDFVPAISGDGRMVAFASGANSLVAGDTNAVPDVFVKDRLTGATQRVSVDGAGGEANLDSTTPSISADGRFVAFYSDATDLVAADTNTFSDVFIRDRGELKDRFAAGDFDANNRDDFVADFGGRGVWALFGGTTWVRLHTLPSRGFGVGDFDATGRDDLAVDFDAGGLWSRYNNSTWTRLHTSDAETLAAGDLDANPRDDLAVDFGAGGLWARYNNATWTRLHTLNADAVDTGDLDGNGRSELIVDFGAGGIWAFFNNTSWTRLNTANPEDLESADLDGNNRDEVIADLGAAGLAARYNNTTTWTTLHPTNPEGLAAGDFDANGKDDLAVDFGAGGLWLRLNNTTWIRVHTTNPQGLATADFDGNNKAELIVDFGAGGIWARYNNATWTRLPALPP
jgi:Tol biopolymer transport system component